jgi:hypothetical protein
MSPVRHGIAIIVGAILATLPFWRYVHCGGAAAPHADHPARHGGQLGMVGDYHIEVRRHLRRVEAFVSDARRRSVRPLEGWVVFDGATTVPLHWENHRLVGSDQPDARIVEAIVVLSDGTRLATSFDFSGHSSTGERGGDEGVAAKAKRASASSL